MKLFMFSKECRSYEFRLKYEIIGNVCDTRCNGYFMRNESIPYLCKISVNFLHGAYALHYLNIFFLNMRNNV